MRMVLMVLEVVLVVLGVVLVVLGVVLVVLGGSRLSFLMKVFLLKGRGLDPAPAALYRNQITTLEAAQ